MDTQTLITTCQSLLNLPDLVLLALILVSACMGASRGIVRTACNALGRLLSLVGASAAAKLLAPVLARFLVTPIVGEVFEVRAADLLSRMPEAVTDGLQAKATQMASEMAESLAFFLLFFIFSPLYACGRQNAGQIPIPLSDTSACLRHPFSRSTTYSLFPYTKFPYSSVS